MLPSFSPTGSFTRVALRCRILPCRTLVLYLLVSPGNGLYDLFVLSFARKTFEIAHLPDISRKVIEARHHFDLFVRGRVMPYGADEVIDTLLGFPDKI